MSPSSKHWMKREAIMPIKQCTSELPLYWSSKSLLTDGTLLLCDVSTQNTTVLSITQHHQTILQCISVHATSITTLTVDLMGPLFHSRSKLVQATPIFFLCRTFMDCWTRFPETGCPTWSKTRASHCQRCISVTVHWKYTATYRKQSDETNI